METFELLMKKLLENNISHKILKVEADSIDVDAHVKALGIKYKEGMSTLLFRVKGKEYIALLRRDDRNINSKTFKKILGTGDFTFCNEDDLKKLNFKPGLASPLLLNDLQDQFKIKIYVDQAVSEMSKVVCGTTSPTHALEIQKDALLKNIGEYEIVDVTIPNPRRQDNQLTSHQSPVTNGDLRLETGDTILTTTRSERILTGIRPTGKLHLGHYTGLLEQAMRLQEDYEMFMMIADVQAFTDNYDNPEKVNKNMIEVALDVLSTGFDPNKSTLFIQSMIPEIAELTIFFMNLVSYNKILRNPTVKTEIKDKNFGESVPFGFIAYPISQAADILFLRSNLVPVGNDQAPMVELADEIGKKFNKIYKTNIFNEVKGKYVEFGRLIGTDGNAKMSKSLGNTIYLSDTPDELKEKVKKMYTDPNRIHANDPGKVEGNPVFIYHDAFNKNTDEVNDLKARYIKGTVGDVEVKDKLTIAINNFLDPIREKRHYFENRKDDVIEIIKQGTEKAKKEAEITMEMVREAMKVKYF